MELVAEVLTDAGYQVLTARDGHAALAALRRHAVQLLLTDVMMPGLDGWQLLAAVRAAADGQALPVLLMTAGGHHVVDPTALDGATAVVWKPFSIDELLERVQRMLSG